MDKALTRVLKYIVGSWGENKDGHTFFATSHATVKSASPHPESGPLLRLAQARENAAAKLLYNSKAGPLRYAAFYAHAGNSTSLSPTTEPREAKPHTKAMRGNAMNLALQPHLQHHPRK